MTTNPRIGIGQLTTANPNLDGTGAVVTIFTAGASGARIDRVRVKYTAANTGSVVRLFVNDGATVHLLTEVLVTAVNPSSTVPAFEAVVLLGFGVGAGYTIEASTSTSEPCNVIVEGLDF